MLTPFPRLLKPAFLSAIISISSLCGGVTVSAQTKDEGNLQYIDPHIGNVGALLEPTRPTAHLPNQMIRMLPVRHDYIDDQISSFPLNVVSHRLGEVFSVKPDNSAITPASWNERMTYDHDLEVTRPWYYSTFLIDKDITVEFAPGKKVGDYKFTFPAKSAAKSILFGLYNDGLANLTFTGGNELTGFETYHDDIKVYVYGKFNAKGAAGIVKDNALVKQSTADGKDLKSYITFAAGTPDVIEFKYAISYVSPQQAKQNFNDEFGSADFETLKQAAKATWAKVVGQIETEGGTVAQRRSFYTALYRCNERMVDINEDGHYYSGYDKKVHDSNRPFYVDDWVWDTYLALHPLRTILNPKLESDMLNSYVNQYEQSGWMPTFPVLFGDNPCMNGFHSTVMFLDDYRKGIRGFDVDKAYEGILKNANEATMLPWENGPKCELDDFYHTNGYFPALKKGEKETVSLVHGFEKRQAVAVTLGGSYDDWAVGQLAGELKKTADEQTFAKRALNYKNLWNNDKQMFIPKDKDGNWIDIDPKFDGGLGGREFYDENNGWTYLWQVQHDIPGLANLMGGQDKFQARLDQLFRESLDRSKYQFWAKFPDATGLVGQYSMGNEPSFHIPYLYNFAGAPWKTQKRVRFLLDVWYKDNIFGIPGDEDGGGMSAFVVFSSMGFYPITPGKPVYTIGSPVFSKVTINLQNRKQFKLVANNCSVVNKYIQSAKFNGQVLNKPLFTHEQLMAGGTLELEMGPKPNKNWGI
ncbi:GH92 family glycosyl hydrolase [Mucilaginibacter rubeus]|uniref:Glycoside hydrolase family 92 protein n=1 Tax=Mucilaginibacter rubeus TaxID=2027860 RepID=A0A5C1HXF2_9SPHI|nr:GH92 family glycosyl hydrolase [Mucilaginibacter rubeus]QEM09850.1 glycoside hydrolase family 92 protein [Mucilaginibacter rubeus]